MKLDIHICLVPRLKISGAKTPLSQAFMTCTRELYITSDVF